MDFKIGDRVFIHTDYEYGNIEGMCGTITFQDRYDDNLYAIKFDEFFEGGHTCGGRVPEGHGWWVKVNYFNLAQTEFIPTSSGNPIIDRSRKLWYKSKYGKQHLTIVT